MTRADIASLRKDVASYYRPRPDLARWPHPTLVACLFAIEWSLREIIMALIDREDRNPLAVERHATSFAENLSLDTLLVLSELGASAEHLRVIVKDHCEAASVRAELRSRLGKVPRGRAVLAIVEDPESQEALTTLRKTLRVDRLTSYRPGKEDNDDLRHDALAAALSFVRDCGIRTVAGRKLPARIEFPVLKGISLPTLDPDRWDRPVARAQGLREAFALLLPVLRGEVEPVAEKVRQASREHFRMWRAMKRSAPEASLDDPKVASTVSLPPIEEIASPERLDSTRVALDAYCEVVARWGEKAGAFLTGVAAGLPISKAARKAGITRQTGHKYMRKLRQARPGGC